MFKKIFIVGFFCLAARIVNAQPYVPVENLVFEGAGIRGIAYCGALQELESKNMMTEVQRVAGTSAGAIMAMAVSLGYNSDELSNIISTTNFKDFNDGKFFFIGGINRMNKYFGWYRSKKIDRWLAKVIQEKTGNPNITFAELRSKGFKDLYVTGTCLNKQKLVIFSHETYPSMRIRDAVRISMSIPLYFESVFLTAEGKIVDHPKDKSNLDIMVDGGFTANFPIRIFDSTRFHSSTSQNLFAINNSTLAFRIDRQEQIKNDEANRELAEMPINNIKTYLGAFYRIVVENLNRQSLTDEDWRRTVSISDGGLGPRVRKLSKYEVEVLQHNGNAAMKKYLQ
jgi:NTE family protein